MVRVLPLIADHNVIQCNINIMSTLSPPQRRFVWRYKTTDWDGLKEAFRTHNWSFIDDVELDDAVEMFTKTLVAISELHIKREYVVHRHCNYPWVTRRGRQTIIDKDNAFGTPRFHEQMMQCKAILAEDYKQY